MQKTNVVVGVAVAGVLFLGFWGWWFPATGRMPPPSNYRKLALEGQPIVKAIFEFRAQTWIWPRTFDD